MRPLVVAIFLAALTVAGSADAKAPPGFQLCGASTCRALAGTDAEVVAINVFYGDARSVAPPNAAASDFYVLRWQFPDQAPGYAYYVPRSTVIRIASASPGSYAAAGMWLQPNADVVNALDAASAGLEAVHPSLPTRVTVAGRPARDPASYMRVWAVGRPALPVHPGGWLVIRVTAPTASPWTDWATDLQVSRRGGWLYRDGTFFRVPATFAARIRARLSLR